MSGKTVTLLHVVRREGEQMVFFYDGMLTAKDGLLTLPVDRPEWVRKAWLSGYNLNPKTKERLGDWAAVEALMSSKTTK